MTTIRVQRQIEELMEQMFPGLDIAAITPTDPVNDETDVYLIETAANTGPSMIRAISAC